MKPAIRNLLTLLLFIITTNRVSAQGTAFTYQGRLSDGVNSANGKYDLTFALFNVVSGAGQVGVTLTNSATVVSNGLFTVTLDFGNQFPGANRWLEISVRTNGNGGFFTLSPRQPLTPAPYAITAASVVSGGLTAGTYGNAVTFNNANNSFSGAFTGNGANVTNVNAASLNGVTSAGFWKVGGNAGANPTNGAFLGTTDNLPLEFRINGQPALRIAYATNNSVGYSPNMLGGFPGNIISNGFAGAVIAGGGSQIFPNVVGNDFATVIGGADNTASGFGSTAIGLHNTASGLGSTAIGFETEASSTYTTAMGFQSSASGLGSTALGYATEATGFASTAMGYFATATGDYSTAMGHNVDAIHQGTFVWADASLNSEFASTSSNQFLIRAAGGVGIGTNNPTSPLHVASASSTPQVQITQNAAGNFTRLRMNVTGSPFWEMDVSSGATPSISWWNVSQRMTLDYNGNLSTAGTVNGSSDRNVKENFSSVRAREVLEKVSALPITEWNYKTDGQTLRHIGPMAQDFYAAFSVGTDDKHISMVDADGVALAAIQGLNEKLDEARAENADLRKRLERLERFIESQPNSGK